MNDTIRCVLIVVSAVVGALAVPLLCGFFDGDGITDGDWVRHSSQTYTKVSVIEGHRYVLVKSYSGIAIVHAESCGCKR